MQLPIAHSLFTAMRVDRVVYLYSGSFHDEHTARLIDLGEAAEDGGRGRLAFIMVEAYQNILRHRTSLDPVLERGSGRSLFMLRCGTEGQQVIAMNPVKKSDLPKLKVTLEKLQGMHPSQLKSLFLSGLQNNEEQPRRGAGLGLIEMARRSGNDLGYSFHEVGEEHELFVLSIRTGNPGRSEQVLNEAKAIHDTAAGQDLLALFIGEYPMTVRTALLRVMEDDLDDRIDRRALRGRAYLAAVSCYDRSSTASARRFVAITREGDHNALLSGVVLNTVAANELGADIARIKALDRSEVDRRYRNALLDRGEDAGKADLYELVRQSVEPLDFAVFPMEGEEAFAVVRAVI